MSLSNDTRARAPSLSPAKQALLERWKRGEVGSSALPSKIARRSGTGPLPLAYTQQRLWFLDQLLPGNPAYNYTAAKHWVGPLNQAALQRSLDEIVRRHEILRTTFPAVEGQPVQQIAAFISVPLPVVDLEAWPLAAREVEVRRRAEAALRQPFDLAQGPLLRAELLRLTETEHVFLFTMHHTVWDGWSMGIFERELAALYEAFCDDRLSPLPELPIQYADYALWQRQWLESGILEEQLAYWKRRLAGAPTMLDLPTDRPRPAIQTMRGQKQWPRFPATLTQALKALSQQQGVSLYMTVLAAFNTLLHRYSGQTDILLGVPIANRTQPETETLIGFFANTLVIRTDLSGDPTFLELLRRVRETTLEAYAHQDLPFERLVEELQPERDMSRNPLFQVMFNLGHEAPDTGVSLRGLQTVNDIEVDGGTSLFDLGLWLGESPEGLRGILEYSTDLFEPSTLTRMMGHFQCLLEGIVANPAQRLSALPLLTSAEREQLLNEWNATQVNWPVEHCLHEWVALQVERTPDAIAVIFDGLTEHGPQALTYRELNQRADQLAHYLRAKGIGPDVPVGVCMERALELVVALLGILKAGGAYLPLDPTYPAERLAFMLEDSQVPVLLTQSGVLEGLSGVGGDNEGPRPKDEGPRTKNKGPKSNHSPFVICLDTEWETITNSELSATSRQQPPPDSLAYIIYTSGSTGKPKGAMLSHQGVCNRLWWMQAAYQLTSADRILQKTSFSFDVSVWEFFWPLITGACLVLAIPEGHKDGAYLVNVIGEQAITTLHFVPSMLGVFLEQPGLETCQSLQRVICSGEALPLEFQTRFMSRLPAELHNLYGPTEASIDVTYWACERMGERPTVPIGRPIANTQLYILDSHLNPVPIGVPGELHIGGMGLARGYLNRPDLTAEKFVPNPFVRPDDERRKTKDEDDCVRLSSFDLRLYKTGDLARYAPDGAIEYLGRLDHQVKVRGFRIELGEIEALLRQQPALRDAIVLAREDAPGEKRLVAYVVPTRQFAESAEHSPWAGLHTDQVGQWQAVFEETYSTPLPDHAPTFNTVGWNSSYTGELLPDEDMQEWVTGAVSQIAALQPKNILEIGCGTGLLLVPLAATCQQYVGTDFSARVLRDLEQHLAQLEQPLGNVTLHHRTADNFEGIKPASFDVVVLNSVIQYFPSIDYLLQVLAGALRCVRPGGALFLGDLRSLPLWEVFHTSVELQRAAPALETAQLRQQIKRRMAQDQELVIDPAFFTALREQWPQIASVEIRPKRGRQHNELTLFRYDVVLHLGPPEPAGLESVSLNWADEKLSLPALRSLLAETQPKVLVIQSIPNARLVAEILSAKRLAEADCPATVGELRESLANIPSPAGIEPEDLWALSEGLPYRVELELSASAEGCYNAFFIHSSITGPVQPGLAAAGDAGTPARPWASYANDPLMEKLSQVLVPEIRNHLKERLPDYMVPAAFVLLPALPLNPNGKVERRALPAPLRPAPGMGTDYVAPRTPVEETLAQIWGQVLGLEQIGIHNNFFELGGDSIRSIQIVARANQAGLKFTTKHLFQHQTIAELAAVVEVDPAAPSATTAASRPLELSPFARWYLSQEAAELSRGSRAVLFEVPSELSVSTLEEAIRRLCHRQAALRQQFIQTETGWQPSEIAVEVVAAIQPVNLGHTSSSEEYETALAQLASQLLRALRPGAGPLVQFAYIQGGPSLTAQFLIAAHPLVLDGPSWRIMLEELRALYRVPQAAEVSSLPAAIPSYQDWLQELNTQTSSVVARPALDEWLNAVWPQTQPWLQKFKHSQARVPENVETVKRVIEPEATRALQSEIHVAYRTRVEDVLVTALMQSLPEWKEDLPVVIGLLMDGREVISDPRWSETAGAFAVPVPAMLELKASLPGQALRSIKEQLRQLPARSIGDQLRPTFASSEMVDRYQSLMSAGIHIYYWSDLDPAGEDGSQLKSVREFYLPSSSPAQLEIKASVIGGCLHLDWTFDPTIYERPQVEAWAANCEQALRALITHCASPEAGGYIPSDFPLAALDQATLDRLVGNNRQIEDIYPLTPMQRDMLFHRLRHFEPNLYFLHLTVVLRGLNVPAFEKAWQWTVDRHPNLRTTFVWEGLNEPLQLVHRQVAMQFQQADWRPLSAEQQEEQLNDYVLELRRQGCELKQAPHTRLALFRITDDDYQFAWSFNYMLQDGWSFPLIMSDVLTCYDALCAGQVIEKEKARPYRDLIHWQQQQDLPQAQAYWEKVFQDFTVPTPLIARAPGNQPMPEDTGFGKEVMHLSLATSTALRSLGRQHQLTLSTLVYGAWAMLLSHYTGEETVMFGGICSGRPVALTSVEQMIGLFLNLLPVRVRVPPDARLVTWLRDQQAAWAELRQYEYTPLAKIQEWIGAPREQLLFETYLVFENVPISTAVIDRLERWGWQPDMRRARVQTEYPVRVEIWPNQNIMLTMSYYHRYFDAATIRRFLDDIKSVLEAIAAKPDQRVGEVIRRVAL
jgi:amino acid adenylation domain-containing protein/non-ribosomal peptide synthase protein (TIGR01720 family)